MDLVPRLPRIGKFSFDPRDCRCAPIQNIGAYGVEISQYCHSIIAFNTQEKQWVELSSQACQFTYRESLFKKEPGHYIITQFKLRLPKIWQAQLHYAELQRALGPSPTPRQIFSTVAAIREKKLPDPKKLANVGSFFKNPLIGAEKAQKLLSQYPDIPRYPQADGQYKIAAAWLIEQGGFKGKRYGNFGVYEKQALVLVHFGGGNGKELLNFAEQIQNAIFEKYAIPLQIEPAIHPSPFKP